MNQTNESQDEKIVVNPKYLDISPISKGKRMLVYLADLFLSFILAVGFFSVAVFPISQVIGNYSGIIEESNGYQQKMMDVLYDNDILYYDKTKEDVSKYDFTSSLSYSADLYLKDLVQDKEDWIVSFLRDDISLSTDGICSLYKGMDSWAFFSFEEGLPKLDAKYVEEFKPLLDEKDQLSSQGEKDYARFVGTFFPNLYSLVIQRLESSEEIAPDDPLYSYRLLLAERKACDQRQDNIVVYATYVSYLLATLVSFLLVPLLSRSDKTIGMMALRVVRIDKDRLVIRPRKTRWLSFFFSFVFSLPLILFVPIFYVPFGELFSLPYLTYLTLISFLFVLASFFFVLFHPMHVSLSDFVSRTVLVTNETMDEVYKARGYLTCPK